MAGVEIATSKLLGKTFRSIYEVDEFVKKYEDRNFVQLLKSRTCTIAGSKKYSRNVNEALVYRDIKYTCLHSGSYKSRSKGGRPMQSTYKRGCPFFMKLKITRDGTMLKIMKLIEEHNHVSSKEFYSLLPRQRILDLQTKEMTRKTLRLGANKMLVQADLVKTMNKHVTLEDLDNLLNRNSKEDTLEYTLDQLQQKAGSIVELVESDDVQLGIFYQDHKMTQLYNCYPDTLFVDAIHEVCNRRMPLYFLLVEDGNGEYEIVGFFLITTDAAATFRQMVQIFKKHNPGWMNTKRIMADKDVTERQIFNDEFPDAELLLGLFHVMRSFRKEISSENLGVSGEERDESLELLQKMAHAASEDIYLKLFQKLKTTQPKRVTAYVENNWHPIRDQWVVSLLPRGTVTLSNRTVKRLEAIYSKVGQIVSQNSNLALLFQDLEALILSLRIELDNKVAHSYLKLPATVLVSCEAEKMYMELLTPYAYGIVAKQFSLRDQVTIVNENDDGTFTVDSPEGPVFVALDECSCTFFMSMLLPCQHVLKVRELKQVDLFSESLVAMKWTKNYYVGHCQMQVENCEVEDDTYSSTVQTENFQLVFKKAQQLASLISESPERYFQQRLQVLEALITLWGKGSDINISSFILSSNDTVGK